MTADNPSDIGGHPDLLFQHSDGLCRGARVLFSGSISTSGRRWLSLALVTLIAAAASYGFVRTARAQVPPHYPGTICMTPQFWCWAAPPGPPGAQCICPTPYGPVLGFLG